MEHQNKKHSLEQTSHVKRKKREVHALDASINDVYMESSFITSISGAFCQKEAETYDNGAKIVNEPFTCCVLPNFIKSDDYLIKLRNDISRLEMDDKVNDLYQFKQSKDLGSCLSQSVSVLKKLLYEDCLEWMKKVTNIDLMDKIDMSCSLYSYTDHLLCHDDELEGRRIAFIFYLVPKWEESDGGRLDLFANDNGQPTEICTSFIPLWNNFIFFEVSPVSFHQVSEVLSDKTRISVSGWFHGPALKSSVPLKETVLFSLPSPVSVNITDWINPLYFDAATQKFHEIIIDTSVPAILKECQNLFCSEPVFLLLSNITGLKLHPLCEDVDGDDEGSGGYHRDSMGKVSSSIRKWSHGSYTLLHDQSFTQSSFLNAQLYFNCSEWDPEFGGYTSYVAEYENEELLQTDPKPNSLALVYITEGTSHFTKYINHRVTEQPVPFFHDIFAVYIE
ncbi:prolyl 3-hydroxylase OGFOD1-like [Stegodyphus dumicola]|uniref:prolyl 3-hydroxylase OGFOD1-like n=1 Tax=Stegodyphus dumicola TaxID=202533 RepID=UPI0015A9F039|nr:prolyl 3-hydroxylase OGFOD1-like [Stegodyphus dumicola]